MKIEVNKKEKPQAPVFSDVHVGDVFVHRAIPYMRMHSGLPKNAINLKSGQAVCFDGAEPVLAVKNAVLSYDEP